MNINTICSLLIDALRNADYNETTISLYQGEIRRFKETLNNNSVIQIPVS